MQEHYLESKFCKDILWKICGYLDLKDIQALLLTSKKMQNQFIEDNEFWKNECRQHFPHLAETIAAQFEPKYWFLVFKHGYMTEYCFSDPKTNQKRAALFGAAKSGNKDQFKAFFRNIPIKDTGLLVDRYGYRCFDWLYQKGYQDLLDEIFDELKLSDGEALSDDDRFNWAILCHQKHYLEANVNRFVCSKDRLSSAARGGNLSMVNLLLEQCGSVEEGAILIAFKDAALCGHKDIVIFLHQKIIEKNIDTNSKDYKDALYRALLSTIENEHKATFREILEISKSTNFDLNYSDGALVQIKVDHCIFLHNLTAIDYAARLKDYTYLDSLLKAGGDPNKAYMPVILAIFLNNYETLRLLLKNGVTFNKDIYSYVALPWFRSQVQRIEDSIKARLYQPYKVKDWIKTYFKQSLSRKNEIQKEKAPTDYGRIDSLVKLTLYKDKIKKEWRTLLFWFLQLFDISRPQDKESKCNASQVLFDVIVGKLPTTELDKLPEMEKAALENDPGSRLGIIYQSFFPTIKQMREDEKKHQASEESSYKLDLNGVD